MSDEQDNSKEAKEYTLNDIKIYGQACADGLIHTWYQQEGALKIAEAKYRAEKLVQETRGEYDKFIHDFMQTTSQIEAIDAKFVNIEPYDTDKNSPNTDNNTHDDDTHNTEEIAQDE